MGRAGAARPRRRGASRGVVAHPRAEVGFGPKKTVRGAGQRIAALARWLDVGEALGDLPSGARLDDVLDALAAAWSAQRWAAGTAEVLGEEVDDRGRPMRVVV